MDEREATLRRRAALVGSALLALGCSTPKARPPTAGLLVNLPDPDSLADPGDDELPARTPLRKSASLGVMPSLEIPQGLSADVQRRFEYLVAQITRGHELLDEIERALPSCRLNDPVCKAWREIAKQAIELDSALRWIKPACPGSSLGARLYSERASAHLDYITARRREVFLPVEEQLERDGEAARAAWENYLLEAVSARPSISPRVVCEDW